ncbi:MAG: M50 family metallopeptidase [Deltaproteobacteria bacterium]|nr:M50 family metallopeptidase [Deltaproteobacteria bacterium]
MSIAFSILGLGLLIVFHEWGHFIVARLCGMRVERFSIGFGNPILKFKRGDTIYQLAPIPLGGFVQITGLNPHEEFDANDPYVYPNRPRWMRLAVLVAGPAANYLTAILIALAIFTLSGIPGDMLKVGTVQPGTPAAAAGLQSDDELLQADGKAISVTAPINKIVEASGGNPIPVIIRRAGKEQTLVIAPAKIDGSYRLGIVLEVIRVPVSVGAAIGHAFVMPIEVSGRILTGLWDMVRGAVKAELSGPIGIAQQMSQAAQRGPLEFIQLVMILSVYLGLFNLLPLPALDGGRIIFILAQGLGIKQITAKAEAMVHMVGMVLMLGLMVFVSFKDIRRLFVGKPDTPKPAAAVEKPAEPKSAPAAAPAPATP